jgi:hypothetical protein
MSSDEQILSKTNTTMTGPENGFIAPLESSHANSAQGVMHTIHEGHAAIAQGVTQNFHEGHAEPAYEYINKYSYSPSLTEDEKNCFMWARDNPFWGKLILPGTIGHLVKRVIFKPEVNNETKTRINNFSYPQQIYRPI